MTDSGDFVLSILRREDNMSASLAVLEFDGTRFSTNPQQSPKMWKASTTSLTNQKYSILVSTDDDTVITFATSLPKDNKSQENECRTDMWQISNLDQKKNSYYKKGERTLESKSCRFPELFSQSPDADDTSRIIVLMTEYAKTTGP